MLLSICQSVRRSARAFDLAILCGNDTAVCVPSFPLSFSAEVAGGVTG